MKLKTITSANERKKTYYIDQYFDLAKAFGTNTKNKLYDVKLKRQSMVKILNVNCKLI